MSTQGTKVIRKDPQHLSSNHGTTTSRYPYKGTSPLDLVLSPPPWLAHTPSQKLVDFCNLVRPESTKKYFKRNNGKN